MRLTEEHQDIRRSVREFVEGEIVPIADALDNAEKEIPMPVIRKMAELGYFGLIVPTEYGGLGLDTMSMALVLENRIVVGQVGDSRVYLIRQGHAQQVTEDHTLINYKLKHGLITPEQAASAPGKNVITRAVGHFDYVEVDITDFEVMTGDRLVLCSDGLHGYLQPGEIERYSTNSLDDACRALIDLANSRGGRDNITALLVEIQ